MAGKKKVTRKANGGLAMSGHRDNAKREYWTAGDGLALVQEWLDAGLYDKDIAANMNITQKTLIDWKKKYPAFRTMFLAARQAAIHEVTNALYRSALGFHETEQVIDNKGKKQVVKKYYAPNVAAGIFLMKNWAPHKYKDKWDVEVNGQLPVVLSGDDEVED